MITSESRTPRDPADEQNPRRLVRGCASVFPVIISTALLHRQCKSDGRVCVRSDDDPLTDVRVLVERAELASVAELLGALVAHHMATQLVPLRSVAERHAQVCARPFR